MGGKRKKRERDKAGRDREKIKAAKSNQLPSPPSPHHRENVKTGRTLPRLRGAALDGASDRASGAEDLLDGTAKLAGHRPRAHLLGNRDHLRRIAVAGKKRGALLSGSYCGLWDCECRQQHTKKQPGSIKHRSAETSQQQNTGEQAKAHTEPTKVDKIH